MALKINVYRRLIASSRRWVIVRSEGIVERQNCFVGESSRASVCSCNRFGISTCQVFLCKFFTTTSSRLVSPCADRSSFPESVDVNVVDRNISLYAASLLWYTVLVTRCCIGGTPGQ